MAPEEIPLILEPFHQLDSNDPAIRDKEQGTGLGLPLTRRLIECHGGQLLITSTPETGTRVTLLFPRHRLLECNNEK
jgi:two-component system cell cycle sensor histidine kinase PleC